jgi:hypothetical protein
MTQTTIIWNVVTKYLENMTFLLRECTLIQQLLKGNEHGVSIPSQSHQNVRYGLQLASNLFKTKTDSSITELLSLH